MTKFLPHLYFSNLTLNIQTLTLGLYLEVKESIIIHLLIVKMFELPKEMKILGNLIVMEVC
jgi:hypothetical protein